jgi:hypothetical protein
MPLTEEQKIYGVKLAVQFTQEKATKDAQMGMYTPPTFDYFGLAKKMGIPIIVPTVVPDNDDGLDFFTTIYNCAFRATIKTLQEESVAA